jgi:hypothetical protein
MTRKFLAMFVLAMVAGGFGACGKKQGFATKMCLSAEGTSQDCGIGCKIEKNEEACKRWADKTKELCPKLTKAECQEICDKDENPTACELAKNMK